MNYFIDFEATQFTEEIISIGCVREDGKSFYSLVKPKVGEINEYITQLTSITAEMIAEAESVEEVFSKFYDWAFSDDDVPNFFCWGKSDNTYAYNTSKRATNLKAKMALGYICGNTIDYAKATKKYLNWQEEHNLFKVYSFFNPEVEQTHNSLQDAIILKQLYAEIDNHSRKELIQIFYSFTKKAKKEKELEVRKWNEMGYPKGTICLLHRNNTVFQAFATEKEAAEWIQKNKKQSNVAISHIIKRISTAASGGKTYFNLKWRIVA